MDVIVVLCIIFCLGIMLLPRLSDGVTHNRSSKIRCTNSLKQIGLANLIWEGDHGDKLPMEVSITNGGVMELLNTPNAWKVFQVMSNELSTPKTLLCPADIQHGSYATDWGDDLKNKISYFTGLDEFKTNPFVLVFGDDNFEVGGIPLKSGLIELSTNAPISWTMERHNKTGNILLGDGSVQGTTSHSLRTLWQQTSLATNRIFIP